MASAPGKSAGSMPRLRDEGWMLGTLVGHGAAPYQHEPENSNSYYIRIRALETETGARRSALAADESARPIDGRSTQRTDPRESGGIRIAWGWDIKRAIEESKSRVKIGDTVGVRRVGRETVDIPNSKDTEPRYKNRWEVETVQFINQRHINARKVNEDYRAARQSGIDDPAARALYLIHAHTEKLAALRYPDPEDQKRFIEGVRRALEQSPEREALIGRIAQKVQAAAKRAGEPFQKQSTKQGESVSAREEIARE
jgi:hypothetical protein